MKRMTLRADGGLKVVMNADGSVGSAAIRGRRLALSGPGGFSASECVQPRGRIADLGMFSGRVKPSGGALLFAGSIPRAGIELTATMRGGAFIDVAGEVSDLTGTDRALSITFTLPLKLAGWRWENTASRSRAIAKGGVYPSDRRDFLYMGKKGDGFANEDHAAYGIGINKLPFSAVTNRNCGLALAYPVHEPRVFLIEASDAGYSIAFSLGVTPITKKFPSRASFRFIVFPVDPEWGIRSAAERYQGFFPELFKVHSNKHGNITSVANPDKVKPPDNLGDLGIAYGENDYQWTNGEMSESLALLLKKHGIEQFHWRGPWYWFHEAPGDITRDAQLALLKAQAEGRAAGAHGINNQLCGCPNDISARAGYNSCLINDEGKLERVYFAYPQYSCWLLPMNMDPNLPKPNRCTLATDWQYRYIKRWNERNFRGPRAFAWDALDDFSGFRRLNFRRDHLAVMDIPATFDPASGRICQVKGFHDWAFAKYHWTIVHKAGGKIMSNVNLEHSMMYCGAYVDVVFRERKLRHHDEERLSVDRMLLGARPIAFMGSWQLEGRSAWLRAAEKALLFGMAPGVTRHVGDLKRIMPVLRRMAAAGWQPVPHARARGLWIERFGTRPGNLYFAVRNPGGRPVRSKMTIDLRGLDLAKAKASPVVVGVLGSPAAKFSVNARGMTGWVTVPPKRTWVLGLAPA